MIRLLIVLCMVGAIALGCGGGKEEADCVFCACGCESDCECEKDVTGKCMRCRPAGDDNWGRATTQGKDCSWASGTKPASLAP
jgi:hypothetical protein